MTLFPTAPQTPLPVKPSPAIRPAPANSAEVSRYVTRLHAAGRSGLTDDEAVFGAMIPLDNVARVREGVYAASDGAWWKIVASVGEVRGGLPVYVHARHLTAEELGRWYVANGGVA